ncbi:MAG: hypothetical protein IJA85_08645, partial [Clostridia bacterium]|nr:hypothetical protein [Clostridia bacterium]
KKNNEKNTACNRNKRHTGGVLHSYEHVRMTQPHKAYNGQIHALVRLSLSECRAEMLVFIIKNLFENG